MFLLQRMSLPASAIRMIAQQLLLGGEIMLSQGSLLQISLVDMLYRKSLRITAASKGKMGVGAIVNLQSNDASKLWGMAQYLHIIWSGPFQVLPLPFWSSHATQLDTSDVMYHRTTACQLTC